MSGCPVDHQKKPEVVNEAPHKHDGCPVQHGAGEHVVDGERASPFNHMASDLKRNERSAGQRRPLGKDRQQSSIPRAPEGETPEHQTNTTDGNKWQYPSAQMLYNAMRRKGFNPLEQDMETIVGIHNAVNEQAWKQIVDTERRTHPECSEERSLYSIRGLSQQLTPKARIYQMLGYSAPFDRHDWVVDRCGTHVRYVIDYYEDKPEPGKLIGVYLDIRPAADSLSNVWDRVKANMFN